MTKTEYRQFIDEVYFLGKQKEYKGIFNKITLNKLNDIRKAHTFALANLFIKYGIIYDDLYDDLDKIWNDLFENKYKIELSLQRISSVAALIVMYEQMQYKIIFDEYLKLVLEHCKNIAKEHLDE